MGSADIRVDYMREFVSLADTMSFTETANNLFITQSALSKHMIELEKILGTTLLVRSPRSVSLNREGQIAYKTFTRILNAYDAMRAEILLSQKGQIGHLVLGAHYYLINGLMHGPLGKFIKAYPDIKVEIKTLPTHQILVAVWFLCSLENVRIPI